MENNLRDGWFLAPLSDLVQYRKGKKPKKLQNSPFESSVTYLDIRAIEKNVDETFADPDSSALTDNGEIVVVWDGARAGWVGLSRKGALGSTLMGLKPKINQKFLYRFLQTQFDYLQANPRGTGIPHVDPDLFWKIDVPIAPQNEQIRIASKIDALFEKIEANKKRLDRIPLILKRFRQSVLAAAVSGRLTEEWREEHGVVEEWEVSPLKMVTKKFTYGSSQKSEVTGKVPVLRMGNIQEGKISWNDLKFSSDDLEIEKYKLEWGDVLFNRTNSPELVGKTAIYRNERPAIYAGYLIRIKTNEKLNPEFLNLCLNTIHAREWCNEVKTDGVSQSNINAQKLAEFRIDTPSIQEQEEIVNRVEQLFTFADKIAARYTKAKAMLDKLPQSILAKAFRGELVPQDPEDEPANLLLDRILTLKRQKKVK